jgi:gas vesicle protein
MRREFAIGAITGLLLPPVVKSKTARRAAVAVTAKGMALKDNAVAAFESVKEDAQDVYAEAKQKNGETAE